MNPTSRINWKLFRLLFGAGVFASLAVLPYVLTLMGDQFRNSAKSLPVIMAMITGQNVVGLAFALYFGLLLGKKVGLGAPILEDWLAKRPTKERLKSVSLSAAKWGVFAGVLIFVGDYAFQPFMESIEAVQPPAWQGFFASFFGGVVEEILMRLFFMTLIVWIPYKLSKHKEDWEPGSILIWSAIAISAVLFGIMHLQPASQLAPLTPVFVSRIMILNGIGAVIFGWLYWKKGLESAMIAHFSTDIVVHAVSPLFLS